jgi:hypothetical protein
VAGGATAAVLLLAVAAAEQRLQRQSPTLLTPAAH